ncbi:DNA-binding transcriptional regulator Fis [Pseudomonadota bacterium]
MTVDLIQVTEERPVQANRESQTVTPLREQVRTALRNYFQQLNGHGTNNLHQMVMAEVERPLLESAMEYTGGNQSRAAEILGISRSTLRKKLALYDIE